MNRLARCILHMQCEDDKNLATTTTLVVENNSEHFEQWQLTLFTTALWFIVVLLALIFIYCMWILAHVLIDVIRRRRNFHN